jgi:hypothetical protein
MTAMPMMAMSALLISCSFLLVIYFFQGGTSGKSFSNSVMSEASYAPAKVPEVNLASPSL